MIAVVLKDEFKLGSPAQHLLDRFLIGFRHDTIFLPPMGRIPLWTAEPANELLRLRSDQFTLQPSLAFLKEAESILVIDASGAMYDEVINHAGFDARIFVQGPLSRYQLSGLRKRGDHIISVSCCPSLPGSATVFSFLSQLPPLTLPKRARIREALIASRLPERDALEAILSILSEQRGGISQIKNVQKIQGPEVWQAISPRSPLLAAVLSRSDNILGNTDLDGRTEDIVALGLIEKMAKNPRALILEHANSARTTILTLEDVLRDIVVAAQTESRALSSGRIYSTQLFQSPSPQQEHYSRLAAAITEFFTTGKPPWSLRPAILQAELHNLR